MTAYGAFVELEEGIDGMVHVSDMSSTRKIIHPSEMLKKADEVEAAVIASRSGRRRTGPLLAAFRIFPGVPAVRCPVHVSHRRHRRPS
jgi:hypothetical protein